jgi:uncharacterized CHY-type Zn-finger protein
MEKFLALKQKLALWLLRNQIENIDLIFCGLGKHELHPKSYSDSQSIGFCKVCKHCNTPFYFKDNGEPVTSKNARS